jgi:hypothetical protein
VSIRCAALGSVGDLRIVDAGSLRGAAGSADSRIRATAAAQHDEGRC